MRSTPENTERGPSLAQEILHRLRDMFRRIAVRSAVILTDDPVAIGDSEFRTVQKRFAARLWIARRQLEAVDGKPHDRVAITREEHPAVVLPESLRVFAQNRRS